MKFAFALFTYFPYGGLTRDLLAIAQACRRRGHRVRVYARECRGEVDAQIDLQLLPAKARTNHGRDRAFAAQLTSATAAFAPDLAVGFNKMPHLDAYYAADGCFAHKSRARGLLYRMTPRCWHFLAFERAVFAPQSATEVLMISPVQSRVYRDFYRTPRERMHQLAPGIARDRIAGDDAPDRRARFRRQWNLRADDKLLLALGSGFRTKGLERTIAALASLPTALRARARLFVVGDDRAAPFERIARRLGVRAQVDFVGGRDDVPEFLLGADLLLHPAHRENTGTALLEAIVAGLPTVATDVCGYAHYVRDAAMGEVLASPFAQSALNDAVARLLESERDAWRIRGRDFAQHADIYDLPSHACDRLEAIARAIGRTRCA
ncbi:MAG: glycosyltransferase family 1 protein [bacterium]